MERARQNAHPRKNVAPIERFFTLKTHSFCWSRRSRRPDADAWSCCSGCCVLYPQMIMLFHPDIHRMMFQLYSSDYILFMYFKCVSSLGCFFFAPFLSSFYSLLFLVSPHTHTQFMHIFFPSLWFTRVMGWKMFASTCAHLRHSLTYTFKSQKSDVTFSLI